MSILRPAQRQKTKLRIGFSAPSGGGKTYSALVMASGMVPWEKIALIDTENGSGDLYSHLGNYNVLTLEAPFTPEKYIKAIAECENAGMEVVIIDSISHEWDGTGGCLEIQEKLGGRYQDWAKVTPRHRAFIDAIVGSSAHIFTTVRRKQDYAMEQNEKGKMSVTKVGLKEVTREGFEYELTINFEIDTRHLAVAGKDRTTIFSGKDPFVITPQTGKLLVEWANSGKEIVLPEFTEETLTSFLQFIRDELTKGVPSVEILERIKKKFTISDEMAKKIMDTRTVDLPDENWDKGEKQDAESEVLKEEIVEDKAPEEEIPKKTVAKKTTTKEKSVVADPEFVEQKAQDESTKIYDHYKPAMENAVSLEVLKEIRDEFIPFKNAGAVNSVHLQELMDVYTTRSSFLKKELEKKEEKIPVPELDCLPICKKIQDSKTLEEIQSFETAYKASTKPWSDSQRKAIELSLTQKMSEFSNSIHDDLDI